MMIMEDEFKMYPYKLRVCSDDSGFLVTPIWTNFCEYVKQISNSRGADYLRTVVDQELDSFGAINPPGDYIRFKTAGQRNWFVLRWS